MTTYFVDTNGNKYPMATSPAPVFAVYDSNVECFGVFGTLVEATSFIRNYLGGSHHKDNPPVASQCTFQTVLAVGGPNSSNGPNSLGGYWDLLRGANYVIQLPQVLYLLTVNNVAKAVFPSLDLANQGANEYAGQGVLVVHQGTLQSL